MNIAISLLLSLKYRHMVRVCNSAIYWSRMALAGDQIDPNVDLTQVSSNPSFRFHDTSYWAHGMSIGLRVEW